MSKTERVKRNEPKRVRKEKKATRDFLFFFKKKRALVFINRIPFRIKGKKNMKRVGK